MRVGILGAVRRRDYLAVLVGLLPFAIFAVAFVLLLRPIGLRGSSDDTAHLIDILHMGVFKWVWMRATTWQPRIVSDLGFAALIFNLRIWKVLDTGIMTALLWLVARTALFGEPVDPGHPKTSRTRFILLAVFVIPMFFLIHPNVITSGSVWYTGSFYYLWPVTFMFIGMAPFLLAFYGRQLPWQPVILPICVLFGVLACFTEQTAAVQFGIMVLVFCWKMIRRETIPRYLIAPVVIIAVTTVVFFYFDMTSIRMTIHPDLQYFPEFAGFSIVKKLTLGVNIYTTHLLHISNILFVVLTVMTGWLVFRRASKPLVGLLAFMPALWALVNTVPAPFGYGPGTAERIGRSGALGFGLPNWLRYVNGKQSLLVPPPPGGVVLAVVALVCVLGVFWLLYLAFTDAHDRFIALALYLAAFLSGLLNGFSPSVFDSGNRPYFVSDFLLLLLLAMLLRSRMRGPESEEPGFSLRASWPARIWFALLVVFACYAWYLYHTVFATNIYSWY